MISLPPGKDRLMMEILYIDDHEDTRREVVSMIEKENDIQVVGCAANGEEGVRLAECLKPDLILLDVIMPLMDGFEAVRVILANDPSARIIVLTNHTGRVLVKAFMDAGAQGYVRKDLAYSELVQAIHMVAGGGTYVGSRVHE